MSFIVQSDGNSIYIDPWKERRTAQSLVSHTNNLFLKLILYGTKIPMKIGHFQRYFWVLSIVFTIDQPV